MPDPPPDARGAPARPRPDRGPGPAPTPAAHHSRWRTVAAFFFGISLLVLVVAFAIRHTAIEPAASMPERIANALAKITRAEVRLESDTITVADSDISELAVVSRQTQTLVKFESDFLGSGNVLIVRGNFLVKAGFDLTQPFSVTFDDATGEIETDFPPAEILSVEMTGYEVVHSQDGFWNRVKPEHQEIVTRRLLLQAKEDARGSDITDEAEERLATRLLDLLGHPPGLAGAGDFPPETPAP